MAQPPVRWVLPVALVAVVAGLSGVVLALGDNGTGPGPASVEAAATEAPDIPAPAYAVGARTETFVDESRPTRAHGDLAAEPTRTLRTLLLYPAAGVPGAGTVEGATPANEDGPFSLIVFTGSPDVPHAQVVAVATLDFWDQQLRGGPGGPDRLRASTEVVGVSRFEGEGEP